MPLKTRKKPSFLSPSAGKSAEPRSALSARRTRPTTRRGGGGTLFPRRRKSPLVVRRIVLFSLLAISLLLLTISYRDPTMLRGAQMQVLKVVAPIEHGLTRAWQPIQGAYDWVARLFTAASENPGLEDRIDTLSARVVEQEALEEENQRLREIVAMEERGSYPAGFKRVVGTVIARSPTAIDRSVVIDLGANDGVKVDDPVMVARGLIGRVQAVSSNAARVGLIVNSDEAVSATVVTRNATGVLHAKTNEGSPVMELSYVAQSVNVEVGDSVTTSGFSTGDLKSIYPHGIPLGQITSVGNSPGDLYKTVQVTPFADFDRIREVIVLTDESRPAPPELP